MRGKRYAILFSVFEFEFTNEITIRRDRLPVTGSAFFGTNSTGAAQGESDGLIHPFATKSARYYLTASCSSAVKGRGGRENG